MDQSGFGFSSQDFYYFEEGTHTQLAGKLGAHLVEGGAHFGVWAPRASRVCVLGDFNDWNAAAHPLTNAGRAGIWQGFVSGAQNGQSYQFQVESPQGAYMVRKADPFGVRHQGAPRTGSILWNLDFPWADQEWMAQRKSRNSLDAPISIYEVHLGSWRRVAEEGNRFLTYDELGDQLIPYVREMGFTHVEFMPVMEHPFYGSWGYQITGFFAPTSRYGTPQQFMRLIDRFHEQGIAVILDWVPSHFPNDEHGLGYFDGAHEYESADPRRGVHPDWNSFIFDYARPEVRSFLLSSALFWLEQYHADALRVDGVASMLYLDYSRRPGEWLPNQYGGRENLDAVAFLRVMNEDIYRTLPDVQTMAEESTSWPKVSRPTYAGGLGFGFKWDMGWMHDTLAYFSNDPILRKYHHNELTFRAIYAFQENFILPLSHDEVVYGKGSLLRKMPGGDWHKFANLRALLAYQYAQPGKKLLFMGGEFGQWSEWNHDSGLDWALLGYRSHAAIRLLVGDLNQLYRTEPALSRNELQPESFAWLEASDAEHNVVAFLRNGLPGEQVLVVCNFSAVPLTNYRLGVPSGGVWKEILNTDAKVYGGLGWGNLGGTQASPISLQGLPYSMTLDLPPLAVIFLKI